MGSVENAFISASLCRLCSRLSRYVVFIFSKEGEDLQLLEKINSYLPVTIARNDRLPQTVCIGCITKLMRHDKMRKKFELIHKIVNGDRVL